MATTQSDTVVGVFETRAEADRAVNELRRAGFREDQIGVVARDEKGNVTTTGDQGGSYAGEGAAAGAVAGAGIGGLVGLGLMAGVIPAIGPIIAAGTLGTILANAAGGAVIAGLAGALVGMGIPKEDAEYYEGELHSGRFLVTVHDASRRDEAWQILHRSGGYNRQHQRMSTSSTAGTAATSGQNVGATAGRSATAGQNVGATAGTHAATSPTTGTAAGQQHMATARGGSQEKMQLHEEELRAHKEAVNAGEVRVHKEVVTEHKTLEVPVQREEVVIERHPVTGGQTASSADIRPGEEIRIPVKEEQVRAEKVPVTKEEVTVGKRQVQGTATVSGTVRKEEARVESEGDPKVCGNDPNATKGKGNNPRKS